MVAGVAEWLENLRRYGKLMDEFVPKTSNGTGKRGSKNNNNNNNNSSFNNNNIALPLVPCLQPKDLSRVSSSANVLPNLPPFSTKGSSKSASWSNGGSGVVAVSNNNNNNNTGAFATCTFSANRSPANSEGRFTCEYCTYKTNSSGALDAHRRIHTGERPFECTACPLRFVQKIHLKRHMWRKHRIDLPGRKVAPFQGVQPHQVITDVAGAAAPAVPLLAIEAPSAQT